MTKSKVDTNLSAKEALIRAAAELFARKGFAAVSTRDIAEAAGVNLGSIQYYFGSKANLFIETARALIAQGGHEVEERVSAGECSGCRHQAAEKFGTVIRCFLEYLIVRHEGPNPCRMMHRELLSETAEDPVMRDALVATITEEFVRPMEADVGNVLSILAPALTERERSAAVRSVVGQCIYYLTHRLFQERLMQVSFENTEVLREISQHIIQFSLRGIGCSDELIACALRSSSFASSAAHIAVKKAV